MENLELETADNSAENLAAGTTEPDIYQVMGETAIHQRLAELEALVKKYKSEAPTNGNGKSTTPAIPKNHQAIEPSATRKYVLLTKVLDMRGRVPRQQEDLSKILISGLEVNKEYPEVEVFNLVTDNAAEHDSIAKSIQHPTYLLRYYRGLKDDGKHAGFIARNFLRVID